MTPTPKQLPMRGASFNKRMNAWQAYYKEPKTGRRVHIAYYTSKEDAIKASQAMDALPEGKVGRKERSKRLASSYEDSPARREDDSQP